MMSKHLYIIVDLHYMMGKHLYIMVDLHYMLIQPRYIMTTTLYYGLYASSSLYGSITSLYAQTSLYDVTTTLYDVDDFARRRITLTPFRELLYTCRDYRTYC